MLGGKLHHTERIGEDMERKLNISSKLGNVLFTIELAKRLDKRGSSKVYANSYFPGK